MTRKTCGATAVFWPDVEACEAECFVAPHGGTVHKDEILGEWDEGELSTHLPEFGVYRFVTTNPAPSGIELAAERDTMAQRIRDLEHELGIKDAP